MAETEQAVENVVKQEVAAAPIVAPPQQAVASAQQPLGRIALIQKKTEALAKHSLMEKISQGIQDRNKYSKLNKEHGLNILDGTETANRRALKINMALRGDQSTDVIQILVGENINPGAMGMVIAELQTMPAVEEGDINDAAIEAFAHYTKEGYENVTGIAKGNLKWNKQTNEDREMRRDISRL